MPSVPADLSRTHADTPGVYQRNARAWDRRRDRTLYERRWLDDATAGAPAGARVLDLGCGAGEPIAAHLVERGFRVTGVDSSEPMIAMCRARFPDHTWRVADMRTVALDDHAFHAVIGWDSFFHLGQDEQRALLPRLVAALAPGGHMLLTIGPSAGEVVGSVAGEPVYHASLDHAEYAHILGAAGATDARFVAASVDTWERTLLLATRAA